MTVSGRGKVNVTLTPQNLLFLQIPWGGGAEKDDMAKYLVKEETEEPNEEYNFLLSSCTPQAMTLKFCVFKHSLYALRCLNQMSSN